MRPQARGVRVLSVTTMSLLSTMHVTAFQLPSLRPLAFRSHLWRPSCGLDQGKRFASDQRRTPARFTVVGCSDGPPEDPNRVSVTGVAYDGPEGCPTVTLFTKAECTLCDKVKDVLKEVKEAHPHSLQQTDITDPEHREWWDRYKYDIPVLHVGDKFWAKHRLTAEEAASALAEAASGDFKARNGQPDAARLERG